jgi:vancomycin aglycone glucosyltransferase
MHSAHACVRQGGVQRYTALLVGEPSAPGGGAQWADQPYFAGRVADLGIGAAHDVHAPSAASLSTALSTALTPQTRVPARAVAGTISTDGATVAAKLLLDGVGG